MLSSTLAHGSSQPFMALCVLGTQFGVGACAAPIGKETTLSTGTIP